VPHTMSVRSLLSISYVGLILRFDGSLRYPSDPGFPVDSLGRMAACAAAIIDDANPGSERTVLVGGRLLDANRFSSSAQAEYEGLLLGLEAISRLQQNQRPPFTNSKPLLSATTTVAVQGDCKTVIEQMQGRSRPRKLESYYEQATTILQELPFNFVFEHIPREENTFCDRLCTTIISEEEVTALRMLNDDIKVYAGSL